MTTDAALETERARAAANLAAWEQVLDQLEADVAASEELLRSPDRIGSVPAPSPWQTPQLDGPLPDQLLARAGELHHRQTAAREALAAALEDARVRRAQARRAVGLGARAQTTAPAAYVDVSA